MNKAIKAFLTTMLAALMAASLFALSACSDPNVDPNAEDTPEEVLTTAVVYFSATGNTQKVADMIAGPNNGMLFDITPSNPYTEDDLDTDNPDSRASQERDSDKTAIELRSTSVPGWENIDTVYIGYPIWWDEAAWPVQSFVAANDFSGKKVIPFCTSSSSGIGNSGEELAALTGTGEWLPGGSFNAETTQTEVNDWVASLGLNGVQA